jgi:outer membrane protein assembly factor BamB
MFFHYSLPSQLLRHTTTRFILPLALIVASASFAAAETLNWPEFRGPTGQGLVTSTRLPVTWDVATDNTWKIAIPGHGWSSPILYNDRIYLTTAVPLDDSNTSHSLRTLCIHAETGNIEWNVEVFTRSAETAKPIHKKNSYASPTPITDGNLLYVHFGPDGTAALELNGQLRWTKRDIKYNAQHGGGGSPIFSGDLLVFNCDGTEDPFVIALRRDSGEVQWKTLRSDVEGPRFSFATPLEIEWQGRRQIVSPASHQVCGYDAASGEELWRVMYPNKWSIIPRPVFSHGLVLVCTGYEGPAELLAIRPDGRGDVTETHVAWRTDENVSHSPSLLVVGNELYMVSDNGIASCRDVQTGELHWRHRLGGNFSASPIHSDGKVYFQSEQGTCTVVAAEKKYRELATNEFNETTFASYAVGQNFMIVRTEGHLYRFDAPGR